jgi:two-component system cell cycle sensor histidine kinase/response regulator CckA
MANSKSMLKDIVYRIAETTDNVQDLQELFRAIHLIIKEIMPANNFYFALYDEANDLISFPYFVDEVDVPSPPHKPGKGLTEYVLRTGRPLLCDSETFTRLVNNGDAELVGEPSPIWLGVPLKIEKKTIGIMVVQHYTDPNAYGENELHIFEYISSQVAKAIERKQSEAVIRQTLSLLEATLDSTADGILVVDLHGKIVKFNKQFAEMWRIPQEVLDTKDDNQALAFVLSQLQHPDSFLMKVRELYSKPYESSFDILTFKDGRVFERFSKPQTIGNEVVGRVWSFRDVTQQKKSEEILREREKHFRALIENSSDVIALIDSHGTIIYKSPSVTKVSGYTPEELIGKSVFPFFHPDDVATTQELFTKLVQNPGTTVAGQFRYQHKNGSWVWIEAVAQNLINEPPINAIIANYRDITERKKYEEALQQSEERYRTLIENVRDAIFRLTTEGLISTINPAFETITGWSVKDWVGKSFTSIIHPDDVKVANEAFRKTIHGTMLPTLNVRIKTKNGDYTNVEVTMTPFKKDEVVVGVLGVARDITERKRLEEQMRQMQKMESIGVLAGGIAHDFNNILGIILAYVSSLEKKDSPAYEKRFQQNIDAIKKAVQRGAGIVRQILTFARKAEISFQTVNVNELIGELTKILSETFPKTIEIKHEFSEDILFVSGDPNQLHQALLNLCMNAKDAMLHGGTLTISTSVVGGESVQQLFQEATAARYVCIAVSDTGIGMEHEVKERVFEPFFTTKSFGSATGLGLSVVYGVVQSHQGFVDVRSEEGKGTTFILYFPLYEVETVPEVPVTSKHIVTTKGSETILVIEDEELLRQLVKAMLEDNGYSVLEAADGEKAVELYTQYHNEIAVVLSDMGLPKLGGWEVFQKMKQINPHIKAILASGYFDPEIRAKMLNAGAKDYVQKPYVPDELLVRIREVIDNNE